ncbi:MAG: hypothetical protein LIP28_00630 [Deltaproteobacteria bacterium]|nr:hypothetical protein [Deltaproteobacteria bacterium]
MKTTFLIIALLVDGTMQIEQTFYMPNLDACEKVAEHQAVVTSYPDRFLYCREIAGLVHTSDFNTGNDFSPD